MNDAPGEDDADLPAPEPVQPAPPAPPMPPGPAPTVPRTGPQTSDISTPPASDRAMESPGTPPPHLPSTPFVSPDTPIAPVLPTVPQKRRKAHPPESNVHTPSQPRTKPKAIPKFVSKPAPAKQTSQPALQPPNAETIPGDPTLDQKPVEEEGYVTMVIPDR